MTSEIRLSLLERSIKPTIDASGKWEHKTMYWGIPLGMVITKNESKYTVQLSIDEYKAATECCCLESALLYLGRELRQWHDRKDFHGDSAATYLQNIWDEDPHVFHRR